MRHLISLLCLLLAALLSTAALAGHQVDQLLRDEQPVREMAGDLPADDAFAEAVSETVVDHAVSGLPEGVQQFVPGGVEALIRPVVASALDNERTAAAWDEVLQSTRSSYAAQLDELFVEGTTGDPREIDLPIDLTPVTDAMTQPLRDRLEGALGMVPGFEAETVQIPAPEMEVNIETVTDESADPYVWATAAAASQHWLLFAIGAAVLMGVGLLIGTARIRWAGLGLAAALATGVGLWIAVTAASPSWQHPADLPEVGKVMLDHARARFTDWAQPAWWVFTGAAGFVVVISVLAAVVTPARREQG